MNHGHIVKQKVDYSQILSTQNPSKNASKPSKQEKNCPKTAGCFVHLCFPQFVFYVSCFVNGSVDHVFPRLHVRSQALSLQILSPPKTKVYRLKSHMYSHQRSTKKLFNYIFNYSIIVQFKKIPNSYIPDVFDNIWALGKVLTC